MIYSDEIKRYLNWRYEIDEQASERILTASAPCQTGGAALSAGRRQCLHSHY